MTSADPYSAAQSRIGTIFESIVSGSVQVADPVSLYAELWDLTRVLAAHPRFVEWYRDNSQEFAGFDFSGPRPSLDTERWPENGDRSLYRATLDLRTGIKVCGDGALEQGVDQLNFLLALAAWRAGSRMFGRDDVEAAIAFHFPRIRSQAFRDFRRIVMGVLPRRLWVMSDIHLECGEWFPEARPEFDALVIAGDVKEGDPEAVMEWISRAADGRPAVFVPGNHDYCAAWPNKLTKEEIHTALREQSLERGITFLEGDEAEIDVAGQTLRFLGCTLWSDWTLTHLGLPEDISPERRYQFALHARREAQHHREGAVDYTRIVHRFPDAGKHGSFWTVADAVAAHARMRLFLEDHLQGGKDTTVVVTHHAPSPRSFGRRYEERRFMPAWKAAFYASDLEDMMWVIGPDVWIHGHIHHRADYVVGETRVVANARGRDAQYSGFDPGFVVEV